MTGLKYISVIAGLNFPYSMIQAIKKVMNNENSLGYTVLSCLCSVIIVTTLVLIYS
jgi:hypothetical protein